MDSALQILAWHAEDGASLRREFFTAYGEKVAEAARYMAVAVARGGKILFAGNGCSAAFAQHWAAGFTNGFLLDRPPLPALALTTHTSVLTSVDNKCCDMVFVKQVQALGNAGDILVGISASGSSNSVREALHEARTLGLSTIGITGEEGEGLASVCDILLPVHHASALLVQELHAAIGHMLCALTDHYLFENVMAIKPMLDQLEIQENNHAHV